MKVPADRARGVAHRYDESLGPEQRDQLRRLRPHQRWELPGRGHGPGLYPKSIRSLLWPARESGFSTRQLLAIRPTRTP